MTDNQQHEARKHSPSNSLQAKNPDPRWKSWILVLLCIEVLYILMEFGFNAALLNVASGLFPDPQSLDRIELAGRLLSGVGFGILVYGLLGMKYKEETFDRRRETKKLAAIMPLAIVFMYFAQEALIEGAIVDKSSNEERFAATYLNMVRPAIRSGALILEDVPITQETSDRPENKAFLAIAGMLMASNDEVIRRIPREIGNIMATMTHRKALESQADLYGAYQEVDDRIEGLYVDYRDGMSSMPGEINKAMAEIRGSDFYRNLDRQLAQAYSQYASGAVAVYKAIGSKTYFKPYYVASSCNQRKTTYSDSTCRASLEKHGRAYYEMTGSQLNVLKFCDLRRTGHQQCDWSAERVGRLVYSDLTAEKRRTSPYPLTVKGVPLGLGKRQFYQHSAFARNFGTHYHQGISLTAKDLVLNSSGIPNAEASVRKALTRYMRQKFVDTVNQPFNTDNADIRYGMSKDQFFRTNSVQSAYRAVLGEDGSDIFVDRNMNPSAFLEKVLLPMSWKTVTAQLEGIPKSVSEMVGDEDMTEQGKTAVRAMVVPPIALVLSLFFSLFTISKVFHHLAAMQFIRQPGSFPLKKVRAAITGTFIVVVVGFPFLLSDNPIVKTGVVQAATGESEAVADSNKLVAATMNWMIRAEPAIYPLGNALIKSPMVPFSRYHDSNALGIGTEDAEQLESLNLVSSLPVSEVQRRLNALGYNAGPVDGLMGGKTMSALKKFQRSRGLPVTGIIDAATSMALIKKAL